MNYDLFIPAAPKDYSKVPYTISSAKYLIPQPDNIFVVSPDRVLFDKCVCLHDTDIFTLDTSLCKFRRPQWITAQFIKLFQTVTQNFYLVVDSDLVFLKPFHIFTVDNKAQFFHAWEQNHPPYFNLMKKVYGFGREYPSSFICEIMLMRQDICKQLLLGMTIKDYYAMICDIMWDGSTYLYNDYDLFGQYVCLNYPRLYRHKNINLKMSGKNTTYIQHEIEAAIDEAQSENIYDIMTLHTWI